MFRFWIFIVHAVLSGADTLPVLYNGFAKSWTCGMESFTRFMQTNTDQQLLNQVYWDARFAE